jgi:hypothetical protein
LRTVFDALAEPPGYASQLLTRRWWSCHPWSAAFGIAWDGVRENSCQFDRFFALEIPRQECCFSL